MILFEKAVNRREARAAAKRLHKEEINQWLAHFCYIRFVQGRLVIGEWCERKNMAPDFSFWKSFVYRIT